jgi:TolA-binding protein
MQLTAILIQMLLSHLISEWQINYNILRKPAAALKSINKAESILNLIESGDTLALKYEPQMFHARARENILFIRGTSNNIAKRYQTAYDNFSAFTGTFQESELLNISRLGAGWALLNLEKYDEAIKIYELIIFDDKSQPEVVASAKLYRAIAHKRNNNKEQARKELSALSMQPSYPYVALALLEIGQMNYEDGNFIQARKDLERAERESVDARASARIHLLLGATYMELGLWERAAAQYDKSESVVRKTDNVKIPDREWYLSEATIKKGIALVKSNRSTEAIKPLVTFIAENKNHPRTDEALFWLAEAYYRTDMLKNSVETYNTLLDLYPDSKRREMALYGLGWSYFRLQDFKGSTQAFEQMITEFPETEYALEVLTRQGDGYYKRKQFSQAAEYYRRASRKAPKLEEGQYAAYQLCHALFRQGAYEKSITASMDFIARYPNSSYAPNTVYLIGWIRFQQDRYTEAIDNFNFLIDSYSRSIHVPAAYYAIGDSYYNMQDFENAMKYYK